MGLTLVTGAAGLLGRDVTRALVDVGEDVCAMGREQLDVSDADAVRRVVEESGPSFIVHCAAWTDVDACESDRERAFAVNASGAGNVARAADACGAKVVAVSTDYVFDGRKGSPYVEDDPPSPVQVYGESKLEGEQQVREACPRHFIVRSTWIYGPGGRNYICKLPGLIAAGEPIRAVADQRGSPTYAPDLADALVGLRRSDAYGTYHVTNEGSCNLVEFARALMAILGRTVELTESRTEDLGRPAPRPVDTTLDNGRWLAAGFPPMRPWTRSAGAFCEAMDLARPTDVTAHNPGP